MPNEECSVLRTQLITKADPKVEEVIRRIYRDVARAIQGTSVTPNEENGSFSFSHGRVIAKVVPIQGDRLLVGFQSEVPQSRASADKLAGDAAGNYRCFEVVGQCFHFAEVWPLEPGCEQTVKDALLTFLRSASPLP